MEPTEKARHWGMVCDHPHHAEQRRAGVKHIACERNGRRLAEAWPFVQDQVRLATEQANALTPAEFGGDREIWKVVRNMLFKKASEYRLRCGYLGQAPWLFVRATSTEDAAECMRQVRARPLEEHDCLTQIIVRRLGGDIDRRARGEDASDALQQEVLALKTSAWTRARARATTR